MAGHVDRERRDTLASEVPDTDDGLLGEERRAVGPHDGRKGGLRGGGRLRDGEKERNRVARDPPLTGSVVQLERFFRVLVRRVGAQEVRRLELTDDEVVDVLEAVLELELLRSVERELRLEDDLDDERSSVSVALATLTA